MAPLFCRALAMSFAVALLAKVEGVRDDSDIFDDLDDLMDSLDLEDEVGDDRDASDNKVIEDSYMQGSTSEMDAVDGMANAASSKALPETPAEGLVHLEAQVREARSGVSEEHQ